MMKIRMVVLLMLVSAVTVKAQWHTKWHEVMGEATMVLGNTKDIHNDINVSVKKKMVMDATLDAIQNAINLRLNPVVSTAAYKTILEKDYLTINDHLIDLLAQQNIIWQRQASPIFVQDELNPKKWTVVIQGLVKKGDLEVPPPVITQTTPPKKPQIKNDSVLPMQPEVIEAEPEEIVVKKEKKRKNYPRFLLGINAGVNYDLPTYVDLNDGEFIDVNESIGFKVGARLPLGRNFYIGADYMMQEWEFGEDNSFGRFGNSANISGVGGHRNGHGHGNHYGGFDYDNFDATHYVSMTGFGFSMGTTRNFVNPSIGVFYQSGEITEIGGGFSGEILKRGATIGLDFGKGRLKFGVEATAFWLNTDANFNGFGEVRQPMDILSDVRIEEANWSFGANIKLFL